MTTKTVTYGEPTVWELKDIPEEQPKVDPDDETDEDLVSPKNDEVPT